MVIDTLTLHIPYPSRRSMPNLFTYTGVERAVEYNGFYLQYAGRANNNSGTLLELMDTNVKIETTGYSENSRVTNIRINPMVSDRWSDTEDIIRVLDGYEGDSCFISNGISAHADLSRIDYKIDLPYSFQAVMSSLIIRTRGTVTTLQDIVDIDGGHSEYECPHANFLSFRIGKNKKYYRIYDFNHSRGVSDEFVGHPRTRIELSVNSKAYIKKLMNSARNSNSNQYDGKYSELRSHLTDIAEGIVNPFKGLLMCQTILPQFEHRFPNSDLAQPSVDEMRVHFRQEHSIEQGFLMPQIRALNRNGNFLRTHHRQFEIHPWNREFQITTAFREETRRFLGMSANTGQIYPADTSQLFTHVPQPIGRWPMELTE